MHDTESTPPLGFVLAWAATKLGDPTVTVRLPSLVLGTAAIPLTYLLGVRTVGRLPALAGAAFLALSPFAIWYADEARAYSTMIFLALLSALALLRAPRHPAAPPGGSPTRYRRCLILYTHYMGVFVVVALAAWSFSTQRERLRELLVGARGIVIGIPALDPVVPGPERRHERPADLHLQGSRRRESLRELTIAVDGQPVLAALERARDARRWRCSAPEAAAARRARSSRCRARAAAASARAWCSSSCSRSPRPPAWRSTASSARTPTSRATCRPRCRRSAASARRRHHGAAAALGRPGNGAACAALAIGAMRGGRPGSRAPHTARRPNSWTRGTRRRRGDGVPALPGFREHGHRPRPPPRGALRQVSTSCVRCATPKPRVGRPRRLRRDLVVTPWDAAHRAGGHRCRRATPALPARGRRKPAGNRARGGVRVRGGARPGLRPGAGGRVEGPVETVQGDYAASRRTSRAAGSEQSSAPPAADRRRRLPG